MGTNDREDSEEQVWLGWEQEYRSKRQVAEQPRTVNKSYESEARLREERQQERDEYEAALEGLGKIGWPCRLRELPDEYAKLGLKLQELKAELQKEKERAALYYSRWEGKHSLWVEACSVAKRCQRLITNVDPRVLTFNEVEVNRVLSRFLSQVDDLSQPTCVVQSQPLNKVKDISDEEWSAAIESVRKLESRVDRLEERAVHGIREVMDGELCCEHYSPEKCGCGCEEKGKSECES
jgi:hypothetical protein